MNSLKQQRKIFLLGSLCDIENLKSKNEAKVLVISDSHGDFYTLKNIVLSFGNTCDALIFCGDGFYDLQRLFEESVFIKEDKEKLPPVIGFVGGNGDPSWENCCFSLKNPELSETENVCKTENSCKTENGSEIETVFEKIFIPEILTMEIAGLNFFVTHGHLFDVYFGTDELERVAKRMNKADVILFGHTHRRCFIEKEDVKLLNPGSISRPRDALPPSFYILEIKNKIVSGNFFFVE